VIALVASLQVLYERVFDQEHRGWRDVPRYFAWAGILLGVLIVEGSISGPERCRAGGASASGVRGGGDLLLVDDALLAGRTSATARVAPDRLIAGILCGG